MYFKTGKMWYWSDKLLKGILISIIVKYFAKRQQRLCRYLEFRSEWSQPVFVAVVALFNIVFVG